MEWDEWGTVDLAKHALERGDVDEARRLCERHLAEHPDDPDVRGLLAALTTPAPSRGTRTLVVRGVDARGLMVLSGAACTAAAALAGGVIAVVDAVGEGSGAVVGLALLYGCVGLVVGALWGGLVALGLNTLGRGLLRLHVEDASPEGRAPPEAAADATH